jgi:hypothetical protein
VTLEAALPYVSIGCALGAVAVAAADRWPGAQRGLKALALLSLAVFAFLRGVAPAGMAMALVLSGLAFAAAPRDPPRRAALSAGLFVLAWLVLAWLCLREGGGVGTVIQPLRLAACVLALAIVGGLVAWTRRLPGRGGQAILAETAALGLLLLGSLTLRDGQWPAMAGALALLLAHALGLWLRARPAGRPPRAGEILSWVLSYAGQAAMAYVFLR